MGGSFRRSNICSKVNEHRGAVISKEVGSAWRLPARDRCDVGTWIVVGSAAMRRVGDSGDVGFGVGVWLASVDAPD
jgi:hypothetical protein